MGEVGTGGRRRRWGLGAGLGSQGFSSVSNFLLVITVARVESPAAFGGFALAYSLFLLVLGSARGLLGESLSVQPRATVGGAGAIDGRSVVGAAVIAGAAVGAPMVLAGILLTGQAAIAIPLTVFGAGLPILLAQDAGRYVGFALGRSSWAAISDGVWLVTQVVGTAGLHLLTEPRGWHFITLWVFASATGWAAIGTRLGVPPLAAGVRWVQQTRSTGLPFAGEFLLGPGSSHAIVYVVGAMVGVVAAGALRAAQTIFGPLNTLLTGVQTVALPEATRSRLAHGDVALQRFVGRIAGAFVLVSGAYALAIVFLPDAAGIALFGESWVGAAQLVVPLALRFLFAASARAPLLGLRASDAAMTSLRVRMLTGLLVVILAAVGAAFGGVTGAAYGLAAAHMAGAGVAWAAFWRIRVVPS